MRSQSYGALNETRVVVSDSEPRGSNRRFTPSSHGNLTLVPNENSNAQPEDSLLQNAQSLPTVIFSDGDHHEEQASGCSGASQSRRQRKRRKRKGFRGRKQSWSHGDKEISEPKIFSPMAFVAPPYIFPATEEIEQIEQEETRRRRSTAGKLSRQSTVAPSKKASESSLTESGSSNSGGSSTSPEEGDGLEEGEEIPKLTRKQIGTIVMFSFVNFASTVVFSCIAPFFPNEAELKGANQTVIGLIFGVFELVIFLSSPFFGRYMTTLGTKRVYTVGLLITGLTSMCFGFLNLLPAGNIFIGLCFLVRIVEALGDSAFLTASFTLVAHEFPGRTSTIIGILETFSGLGFTVGPPIGGALYELGGYQLPFLVLGILLVGAGIVAVVFVPKQNDAPREQHGGILRLIRFPAVILMCSAIFICAVGLSFIDPTFEDHLASFNLGPLLVGFMFLGIGGTYTVSAPLWGYFIDKTKFSREVMIFGAVITAVGLMFLGPSPIFGLKKSLWIIVLAEIALGLGIGALFIPTFQNVLNIAREKGYPDSYETYGAVSGLFQATFSFGGFFGPTIFGGAVVDAVGFSWTATVLAGLNLIVASALISYQLYNRRVVAKRDALVNLENGEAGTTQKLIDTDQLINESSRSPDSGLGKDNF